MIIQTWHKTPFLKEKARRTTEKKQTNSALDQSGMIANKSFRLCPQLPGIYFSPSFKATPDKTLVQKYHEIKAAGETGVNFGQINIKTFLFTDNTAQQKPALLYSIHDKSINKTFPVLEVTLSDDFRNVASATPLYPLKKLAVAFKTFNDSNLLPFAPEAFNQMGALAVYKMVMPSDIAIAKQYGIQNTLEEKNATILEVESYQKYGQQGLNIGSYNISYSENPDNKTQSLTYKLGNEDFIRLEFDKSGKCQAFPSVSRLMVTHYVKAFGLNGLPFKDKLRDESQYATLDNQFVNDIKKEGPAHFSAYKKNVNTFLRELKSSEQMEFGDFSYSVRPGSDLFSDENKEAIILRYKGFPCAQINLDIEQERIFNARNTCNVDEFLSIMTKMPDELPFKKELLLNLSHIKERPLLPALNIRRFLQQREKVQAQMDLIKSSSQQDYKVGRFSIQYDPTLNKPDAQVFQLKLEGVPLAKVDIDESYHISSWPILDVKDFLGLVKYFVPPELPFAKESFDSITDLYGIKEVKKPCLESILSQAQDVRENLLKINPDKGSSFNQIHVTYNKESQTVSYSQNGEIFYNIALSPLEIKETSSVKPLPELLKILVQNNCNDLPFYNHILEAEDVAPSEIEEARKDDQAKLERQAGIRDQISAISKQVDYLKSIFANDNKDSEALEKAYRELPTIYKQLASLADEFLLTPAIEDHYKTKATGGRPVKDARALDHLRVFALRSYFKDLLKPLTDSIEHCPDETLKKACENAFMSFEEDLCLAGIDDESKKIVSHLLLRDRESISDNDQKVLMLTSSYPRYNRFWAESTDCQNLSGLKGIKRLNFTYFPYFKETGPAACQGKDHILFNPQWTVNYFKNRMTKDLYSTQRHEFGHKSHSMTDPDRFINVIALNFLEPGDTETFKKLFDHLDKNDFFNKDCPKPSPYNNNKVGEFGMIWLEHIFDQNLCPKELTKDVKKAFSHLIITDSSYLTVLSAEELNIFEKFAQQVHKNIKPLNSFSDSPDPDERYQYNYFCHLQNLIDFIENLLPDVKKQKLLPKEDLKTIENIKKKFEHYHNLIQRNFDVLDYRYAESNLRELIAVSHENNNYIEYDEELLAFIKAHGYNPPTDRKLLSEKPL